MKDQKERPFRADVFKGMALKEDDVGAVLDMIAAINVTASKLGCRAGDPAAVIELISEVQKMAFETTNYVLDNLLPIAAQVDTSVPLISKLK